MDEFTSIFTHALGTKYDARFLFGKDSYIAIFGSHKNGFTVIVEGVVSAQVV